MAERHSAGRSLLAFNFNTAVFQKTLDKIHLSVKKNKLNSKSKIMKITVCGSLKFAKEMVELYRQLEKIGHQPLMGKGIFELAEGTSRQLADKRNGMKNSDIKRKYNAIKWWHSCIKSGDAILVCNFDKNGIKNYIGGNVLMEMGFAHVNDKKIFLLNPIPKGAPYVDEIKAMTDVILNGDLTEIK